MRHAHWRAGLSLRQAGPPRQDSRADRCRTSLQNISTRITACRPYDATSRRWTQRPSTGPNEIPPWRNPSWSLRHCRRGAPTNRMMSNAPKTIRRRLLNAPTSHSPRLPVFRHLLNTAADDQPLDRSEQDLCSEHHVGLMVRRSRHQAPAPRGRSLAPLRTTGPGCQRARGASGAETRSASERACQHRPSLTTTHPWRTSHRGMRRTQDPAATCLQRRGRGPRREPPRTATQRVDS